MPSSLLLALRSLYCALRLRHDPRPFRPPLVLEADGNAPRREIRACARCGTGVLVWL